MNRPKELCVEVSLRKSQRPILAMQGNCNNRKECELYSGLESVQTAVEIEKIEISFYLVEQRKMY